jgi:hypothetical protein
MTLLAVVSVTSGTALDPRQLPNRRAREAQSRSAARSAPHSGAALSVPTECGVDRSRIVGTDQF